ncbi:unnamed protein product [Arctia plantaginis]|uniref:Uncharacterized protein n=1 Tax=Arctia plantaginis TaxID=874455 RepID=A0A8S0ZLJ1_ARCPL|nr:unnamed protein product [Arctia plantaginis]
MNTVIVVTLLTVATILVKSKTIPSSYIPAEDLLGTIFADEKPKVKVTPRSCTNNSCTIEEIYEIFGVEPIPVEVKMKSNTTGNRVAFAGEECPSKFVRVGDSCIETD